MEVVLLYLIGAFLGGGLTFKLFDDDDASETPADPTFEGFEEEINSDGELILLGSDGDDTLDTVSIKQAQEDGLIDGLVRGIEGGDGNDTIYAGLSHDWRTDEVSGVAGDIFGGAGDDQIRVGIARSDSGSFYASGINRGYGGDGDDRLFAGDSTAVYGGEGDDRTYTASEWYLGGFIEGGSAYGGNGDDRHHGLDGYSYYEGGDGNDLAYVADDSTAYGGNGDDTLYGLDANNTLYGGAGADLLIGEQWGEPSKDYNALNVGEDLFRSWSRPTYLIDDPDDGATDTFVVKSRLNVINEEVITDDPYYPNNLLTEIEGFNPTFDMIHLDLDVNQVTTDRYYEEVRNPGTYSSDLPPPTINNGYEFTRIDEDGADAQIVLTGTGFNSDGEPISQEFIVKVKGAAGQLTEDHIRTDINYFSYRTW